MGVYSIHWFLEAEVGGEIIHLDHIWFDLIPGIVYAF